MEYKDGKKAISARNRDEWRKWLEANHDKETSVWLVLFHKNSQVQSVTLDEATEEALCFGWIDSKAKKRDAESYYLTYSQRKPKSFWSSTNKERVEKLARLGLMTEHGLRMINLAKQTGMWDASTGVQDLVIPEDLRELFALNKKASENFDRFSPSARRMILQWILNARKPETRQKRIEETVRLAAENKRAYQS